jgi:hypothetical protein
MTVSLVVSLGRALTVSHRKREACLARNEAILFQADAPQAMLSSTVAVYNLPL